MFRRRPRCPDSHRQYGDLAEQIAARVEEQLAVETRDPQALLHAAAGAIERMSTIGEEIFRRRTDELILAAFRKLDPKAQWQLLAECFDDATIRQALEREHARVSMQTDPQMYVRQLAQDSSQTGVLNLEDLPPDATLTLFLYEKEELFWGESLPGIDQAARTIFLRQDDDYSDEWRVLNETHNDRYSGPKFRLDPGDRVQIGSWDREDEVIEDKLRWGVPLRYRWDGDTYGLKMLINRQEYQMFLGRCAVNGVEVFGPHRPKPFQIPTSTEA